MKYLKRYSLILFAVIILAASIPVQALAVDPVSAAAISNAFAQAVAAYGASNGVALTFDVADTNGIGEGVHELWKNFREDNLDADDYDTLAAALFPHLYYKAASAVSDVATAYTVGVKITSEFAEEFDNFYNWLLSGPAEMEKVDNQYYEWQQAQTGSAATSIELYGSSVSSINGVTVYNTASVHYYNQYYDKLYTFSSPVSVIFKTPSESTSSTVRVTPFFLSESPVSCSYYSDGTLSTTHTMSDRFGDLYWWNGASIGVDKSILDPIPLYYSSASSSADVLADIFGAPADVSGIDTESSAIGVHAYRDAASADFPDTADPNYDALNRAKDIPLNIPWDDTLYGDGTGTLSDAQSGTIANDVSLAIESDRILELAEEAEAVQPAPDPSEVILPFIPVTLPHFDFSLSGIWHYVREWVGSLGAWLSTMFAVWNSLPWAMVVPVYASLVIVIVLGLYKRFFM